MSVKPTDIFNSVGVASEEMKRKLLYQAMTGNENVLTAFEVPLDIATGPRAEARREKNERERAAIMQMALASAERIEQFRTEMKEVEEKRLDLLARTEEDLRVVREKLQHLRHAAPEIEFPDGTLRKVFRDYDDVRDEKGALVDPSIVKAEVVSNDPRNWDETVQTSRMEMRLQARHERLLQFGEEMKEREQQAGENKLSDRERSEFKSNLQKALADEETAMNREKGPEPAPRKKTFQTDLSPTAEFTLYATRMAPQAPDRAIDDVVRPPGPIASTPAPR